MNEFVVWDKRFKIFANELSDGYMIDLDNRIKIFKQNGIHVESDELDLFEYIGKTDINGNKIYADSSIVEFEVINGCVCNILEVECDCKYSKHIGYFSYNSERLCYELIQTDSEEFNRIYLMFIDNIKNIKVIGTIQENKDLLK
jgi:hypothetical protein